MGPHHLRVLANKVKMMTIPLRDTSSFKILPHRTGTYSSLSAFQFPASSSILTSSNIYTFMSLVTMTSYSPFVFCWLHWNLLSDMCDNCSNETTLVGLLQEGAGCFDQKLGTWSLTPSPNSREGSGVSD